jgi:hypothetical protein
MDEMDKNKMDEEAEREGIALERSREFQVKKPGKKLKTKPVTTKVLDESFFDHYGYGFISRKNKKE